MTGGNCGYNGDTEAEFSSPYLTMKSHHMSASDIQMKFRHTASLLLLLDGFAV